MISELWSKAKLAERARLRERLDNLIKVANKADTGDKDVIGMLSGLMKNSGF